MKQPTKYFMESKGPRFFSSHGSCKLSRWQLLAAFHQLFTSRSSSFFGEFSDIESWPVNLSP